MFFTIICAIAVHKMLLERRKMIENGEWLREQSKQTGQLDMMVRPSPSSRRARPQEPGPLAGVMGKIDELADNMFKKESCYMEMRKKGSTHPRAWKPPAPQKTSAKIVQERVQALNAPAASLVRASRRHWSRAMQRLTVAFRPRNRNDRVDFECCETESLMGNWDQYHDEEEEVPLMMAGQ